MINYRKGKNIEEELSKDDIPIENLPENFLWMHVKGGTKVSNVIDYAVEAFKSNQYRSVVWTGSGGGVGKTISCAEIMKRDLQLHQLTTICYRKVEEYWDPIMDGLEQIIATRRIPCVHILLSLDDIDSKRPSYQFSKEKTNFWKEHSVANEKRTGKGNRFNRFDNRRPRSGRLDGNVTNQK